MKYVPGIIPPGKKLLPGYFKETPVSLTAGQRAVSVLLFVCAAVLAATGLVFARHPLLTLFFFLAAVVLFPQGRAWIERSLRFRLTTGITASFMIIIAVGLIPLFVFYGHVDQQEAILLKQQQARQEEIDHAAALVRQQREDSTRRAQAQADSLQQSQADKAVNMVKQGKYEPALPLLTSLINAGRGSDDLHYYRALCYAKAGLILDAVNDLKPMLESNDAAAKLYDRINPLIKHIAYYVTRCRDGSTSNAKGRGACSHHGGVVNWNDPVYETSRKYE